MEKDELEIVELKIALLLLLIALLAAPAPALADTPVDHLMRGFAYAAKKYPEEAAAEFERYPDLGQLNVHQLNTIVETYFEAGKTTNALRVSEFAMGQAKFKSAKADMGNILRVRGDVFASLNKRDEAVKAYEQAAVIDPDYAHTYLGKAGLQYLQSNRYKEALPLLKKGIKAGEQNGFAQQDLGRCYLQMKQPAEAIAPLLASVDEFDRYRKKHKDAFMKRLIQSYNMLIQCYEATGKPKEARVWRERRDTLVGSIDMDLFGNP